jgi:alkanesulfonate monooxygenase SsuD/methylene tetrahydromethanopterin reductase-like flavin-dependent oxidoreductase (luciferase family)
VTLAAKSPRRSGIPVIIGGNSDAALSRAGRLGDGWAGIDLSPIETDSRVRTFRTICADLKRESQKMVVSMRKRVEVEGSRGAASIDKMRSEIVEYARAGVNLLIFDVLNLGNPTAAIERLAERVLDAAADV